MSRNRFAVALAGICLWLGTAGGAFGAGPWCVAANGNGADGLSWSTAFTNLQAALNVAQSNDSIYLAGQTFVVTNTIQWTNSFISIVGGYAGSGGIPGTLTNTPTVLTRWTNSNMRIMTVSGVTNGWLQRVTITGGKNQTASPSLGGGVLITNSSSITLSSCTVSSNEAAYLNDDNSYHGGGGIYSVASSVLVTNCVVAYNKATANSYSTKGAGIFLASGSMTLQDTAIFNNRSTLLYSGKSYGGGMYVAGTAVVQNCLLYGNDAGGVSSGNTPSGDAVYLSSGSMLVNNCTVADHVCSGLYQAGGSLAVTNSILWANGNDIVGTAMLGYSDVMDGHNKGINGCISINPLFERTYYLATNSPCVNAGSTDSATAGLNGKTTRIDGGFDAGTVDPGYHYPTGMDMAYADIYVATNGSDGNIGTNATIPFKTIGKAIAAAQDGTIIHVAAGQYAAGSETFPLTIANKVRIQLLGTNAAITVLNAGGVNTNVLTLSFLSAPRIEKLTLTGGNKNVASSRNYGGCVYLSSCCEASLGSCVISNNNVVGANTYNYGGGIYLINSSVSLTNCDVQMNSAQGAHGYGGGIYIDYGGTVAIRESAIHSNQTSNIYVTSGSGGAGVYMAAGTLTMRDALVYANNCLTKATKSDQGDGFYVGGGVADLENCTIVTNFGLGVMRAGGTVVATNCIVWGNGVDVTGTLAMAWSDVGVWDSAATRTNCISADPHFKFAATNDYRLLIGSPCVDAGTNLAWMTNALDLAGAPRIQHKQVDMGAYETSVPPAGSALLFR